MTENAMNEEVTAEAREFRQRIKDITMRLGVSEAQAEVVLKRIGERLAGYSHAEAVRMHPDA